jgi:outer membrane immunogenic protein
VAAVLGIAPAAAADMGAIPAPTGFYPPPPVVRVYNWTGCYLGAQLGGAWADNEFNGTFLNTVFSEQDDSSASVLAGGQVGCDLQFARNWVIGAQVDGAWTNLTANEVLVGSQNLPAQGSSNLSGNLTLKTNALATATGRIGYAVNFDSIAGLFYLKGGAAFMNSDSSTFDGQVLKTNCLVFGAAGCTAFSTPVNEAFNFSAPPSNRWGWTIGLGTEWVIAGNWSIFGEWDYMNFGTNNVTFTDTANNLGSAQISLKQYINEFKMGINYRFGNPLPGYP